MINIKTYIAHCKKLKERKKNLIEVLPKYFSNYDFYEDYDGNELTQEIINEFYDPSPEKQFFKYKLWHETNKGNVQSRLLNLAEISLTIKHYKILKKISESNDEIAIVLEDDVVFCENFNNLFNFYLTKTPNNFDVIFFGSGAGLIPKNVIENQLVYLKDHPASRCADSYIITKKAASDIIKTYIPFNICSDYELAYQMYHYNHTVYWWEPSLVKQGSEIGLFKSTLR